MTGRSDPGAMGPLLSRRTLLLGGAAAGALAATSSLWAAAPAWAAPTTTAGFVDAWDANRGDDPYLADWSTVGYKNGKPIPGTRYAASWTSKVSVRDHGATGDGATDDHAAFTAAIAAAGTPGIVEVPAGRYLLTKPLLISRNDVVLRGAGKGSTTLYFPNTLADSLAPPPAGPQSPYSWAGGQVWFSPASHVGIYTGVSPDQSENWQLGSDSSAVTADARRGATTITVANASKFRVGQPIILRLTVVSDSSLGKAMCGDVPGASLYDWGGATWIAPGTQGLSAYTWPVRISAIEGTTITLAERTHLPIRAAWSPTVHSIRSYTQNVGVEHLTIENKLIPQTAHNTHPGSNGVYFGNVIDGWVREVDVVNVDVGFGLTASKHVTVHGATVRGRASHHPFACRAQSHDNMFEYFRIAKPTVATVSGASFHGINVEAYSSGNVWRQGVMEHGTFDSHRGLPFDALRTAVVTANIGGVGGAAQAGPNYGARVTHWGITGRSASGGSVSPAGIAIDDAGPRALLAGITGVTSGGSSTASPIPPDRLAARVSFGTAPTPVDLYLEQRRRRGFAWTEPNPRS